MSNPWIELARKHPPKTACLEQHYLDIIAAALVVDDVCTVHDVDTGVIDGELRCAIAICLADQDGVIEKDTLESALENCAAEVVALAQGTARRAG